MRAIVHKTKGKLDLRAITTFGLNSKPNTDTPIGYFGTGLKYAIAVLARNNIRTTIYIDGKKWTIEKARAHFRDKDFESLFLKRHTLMGKTIQLPFTTDLGKNWEIWQAFRELECNTRDEKGETFFYVENNGIGSIEKGYTSFVIEDERYVNEYLDRDRHFLPGGLTQRDGTDSIQVFAQKSNYLYYRGVRIYDLKEPTANTYNFLKSIELTEDRTAKHPWALEMDIEKFLAQETKNAEVIERAVTAPVKTYERGLSYEYTTRSPLFLDTISSVGDMATEYAKSTLKRDRPPPKIVYENWIRSFVGMIRVGDWEAVKAIAIDNKTELCNILEIAANAKDQEKIANVKTGDGLVGGSPQETEGAISGRFESNHITEVNKDDDIPF